MAANRKRTGIVFLLVLALMVVAVPSVGCIKKGSSGLTFYEFFDPT